MIESKENDKFDLGAIGLTNGITIVIHYPVLSTDSVAASHLKKKKKEKHWPAKALYFFVLFE